MNYDTETTKKYCYNADIDRNEVANYLTRMGYVEQVVTGKYIIKNLQAVFDILGECSYDHHHSATRKGYISRKNAGELEYYDGRYGKGFIIALPSHTGTMYHTIKYHVKNLG